MTVARPHWRPAYVGVGSNLDDPPRQVRNAFDALGRIPDTQLVRVSSLYRSAPMDGSAQPDYINAVAALLTQLEATAFFRALQAIEIQQGRKRPAKRWAARPLDLDLLVFGEQEICNDDLTVPHAGIAERRFVLKPLCEIAPQLRVPGHGLVQGMLDDLPAGAAVELLENTT
jgi:2-amino-4-hydroxy-6-hydroxymethyldihydropteridine diphosphokinase